MSPSRLVAVPTSVLYVDPRIAQQSPKGYTQSELQEIAATVPAIYSRMNEGWRESDFNAARWSSDIRERQLGETYHRLWQDSSASQSLHAHHNGRTLEVDSGNHRVRAAQQLGVPILPVWVEASTERELRQIEEACQQQIDREGNTQIRRAHENHESQRLNRPLAVGERLNREVSPEHDLGRGLPPTLDPPIATPEFSELARQAASERKARHYTEERTR